MTKLIPYILNQLYFKKLSLALIITLSLLIFGHSQLDNDVLADDPAQVSLSGWLTIGIEEVDLNNSSNLYMLTDDQGRSIRLFLEQDVTLPVVDIELLDRQYVTVTGRWTDSYLQGTGSAALHVQAIELASSDKIGAAEVTAADISGSQPWLWILCKFSDVAAEPVTPAYFETLRDDLDPYFREASYDQANIAGSNVVGWYTLPQPKSYYVYDMNGDGNPDLDYNRSAGDCAALADPDVDFSQYYGLNITHNTSLIYPGVTTAVSLTLDGQTKWWPATWLGGSNSGAYNMALTAHEMYHGFGLGHSAVRNPDGTVLSGNSWDPVGIGACGFFSCTPSHTPAPQKDELGWIEAGKMYTATLDSQTVTLEALALPQTNNYLMAKIPLANKHFYTLEARRQAGYDTKVPGATVLIHEVNLNPGAFSNGHIGLIPVPGQADPGGTGAMWTVGETFIDTTNGITVSVEAATASGFQVSINKRPIATSVIYVDADAGGANNGSSWTDAYTDLQAALAAANPPGLDIVEIWVAAGTYKPTGGADRSATFQLKNNVFIYGGFAGTETSRSQRNISAYPTILSGDLQGNDNSNIAFNEPSRADNSYHVVTDSGSAGVIDGVIISGGNASNGVDVVNGGGMYNLNGAPKIINVVFSGNSAELQGGGMYNYNSNSELINVIFSGNHAAYQGGGIYNVYSSPKLTNVTLSGNEADVYTNSQGGGIYNHSTGGATIANAILWGNSDFQNGTNAVAQLAGDGSFSVTYSLVQGGYSGTGNISSDPQFVDADGADNVAGTLDDDLHLQETSPAIDAGNNEAVPVDVTTDRDGRSRFFDHLSLDTGNGTAPLVDMGAYEAITQSESIYLPIVLK